MDLNTVYQFRLSVFNIRGKTTSESGALQSKRIDVIRSMFGYSAAEMFGLNVLNFNIL